jgi:hypothetical protein
MSKVVGIIWFPHSGCRWLNRSLLGNHSKIFSTELFLPFLTHSTDMILNLDRSSQVHKTRSISNLSEEFEIVKNAVNFARIQGIKKYFELKLKVIGKDKILTGAISPGAPELLIPDIDTIHLAFPDIKIIHLVRNPIDCFLSMKSRYEMDGDVYKIASLWSGFNARIRNFGENFPEKYYLVKYEELKINTSIELNKICDWIGLDYEEDMIKDLDLYHGKNKGIDLRSKLSNEEENNLIFLSKLEAQKYNYFN